MSDLSTQFQFHLISEFAGYNSSRDKTNINESYAVRGSKNVYKKLSGTWSSRPGMKRRGEADTTVADIKSAYVWNTSLGETLPLRVCNSKLQVESKLLDGSTYAWYDLMTSLTKTRFVFDTWWDNTNKKDILLFVMGNSNLYSWSGGITKIASGTTNTITKSDTTTTFAEDGFSSTGTIIIGGVEYAYTGGTGTSTLTGVTPDASAITTNVGVEKPITNTNKPASGFTVDFIKTVNNQIYCGSYNSRLVYVSTNSDYTDYSTIATPRVVGNAILLTLDNNPKGITVRNGKAHIGAGSSDWYIVNLTQTTISTAITETVAVEKKHLSALQAPLAHEFIDVVGDTIVYLSQDNQVRTFGDYTSVYQPAFPCLSQAVFSELEEEDFTGGHLRTIGDFIYITSPLSGKVFLHQTRLSVDANGVMQAERFWHPYQQWNATRIEEIDGVVYAWSASNPQIYQVWDTLQWHDDSPSDESLPYDCVLRMAYRNHGRRQGMITFDKLYTEGYISPGTNLKAYILYEYQGAQNITNSILNSVEIPCKTFVGSVAPAIGDASIGDNPLGDGLTEESSDQEQLPKFKVIKSLSLTNCSEYQVVIYSDTIDSRWEVLSLGTNATLSDQNMVHLITY